MSCKGLLLGSFAEAVEMVFHSLGWSTFAEVLRSRGGSPVIGRKGLEARHRNVGARGGNTCK